MEKQPVLEHSFGIGIADDFDFELNIAIRLLLKLYCQNSQFLKEARGIQSQIRNQIRKESNEGQHLIDKRGAFQILTTDFKSDWQKIEAILSVNQKLNVRVLVERWGLRCDWGCGFLLNANEMLASTFNLVMALSRTPTKEIKYTITPFTTVKEIREFDNHLFEYRTQFKKNLKQSDFRMGKTNQKPVGRSVIWLFSHITPPYLSPVEISDQDENGRDQFYIQTCYQDMAKLLHIELKRGWQKGKRRSKLNDSRLPIRNELKVKI